MKSVWLKSAVMIIAFVMVIFTIRSLKNSDTLEKGLDAVTYTPASNRHLTWCETRVNKIEVPEKFKMFQKGMKWFRETPNGVTVELGFVPVEKWFSKYCKMPVDGITENFEATPTQADKNSGKIVAQIGFIKGADKAFTIVEADLYAWDKWSFRSQTFIKALEELADLPEIGGSAKGPAPGH